MKISLSDKKTKDLKAELELRLVDKDFSNLEAGDKDFVRKFGFEAEVEDFLYLPESRILYAGIGEAGNSQRVRTASAQALARAQKSQAKSLKLAVNSLEDLRPVIEGLMIASYHFDDYKNKKGFVCKSAVISIAGLGSAGRQSALKQAEVVMIETEAQNYVRSLVNQPPMLMTPLSLANEARKLGRIPGIKVTVKGEDFLKKNQMGAFHAVSLASPYPPQLLHLSYKHPSAKTRIVLVGKGLTYDTGGLSIKPSEGMLTMKMDKAGGAAIMGIIKAIALLKLKVEIHAVVGAVENVVGKHAFKPDDILTAMNGKTIEVRNTDAEGRLVLADCLVYAQKLKPDYLIDIATLTGASVVGLGRYTAALMGWNRDLLSELEDCGEACGETVTDLPFHPELKKTLKSEVADISNIANDKYGGAITAGLFLSEFVAEPYCRNWVHIDIAGPAFAERSWGPYQAGATGAGVKLLLEWVKRTIAKSF